MSNLIKFNTTNKCVVCEKSINLVLRYQCTKCGRQYEPTYKDALEKSEKHMIVDMKSNCCDADIDIFSSITCSEKCHEEYVKSLENKFGKYKKITDIESGITYRVPTRDIIEKGIKQEDLPRYPVWNEDVMNIYA